MKNARSEIFAVISSLIPQYITYAPINEVVTLGLAIDNSLSKLDCIKSQTYFFTEIYDAYSSNRTIFHFLKRIKRDGLNAYIVKDGIKINVDKATAILNTVEKCNRMIAVIVTTNCNDDGKQNYFISFYTLPLEDAILLESNIGLKDVDTIFKGAIL